MTEIDLDIARLRAAYADGLAPAAVIDAVYDRIAAADDPGIFITLVDRTDARAAAGALGRFDPARPLWGVPFAVKDNIDVAGLPTTAACPDFAYRPDVTAPAVARLMAAGAILVGKTNLDQFATGLVGVRTPYPVPRNACDPALVPGGSSSGSAVAVARRLVSFALGTDTAGSGRVPAALNGIVGLKPTKGTIPTAGVVPACRSLDCVSIFAGSVADAWTVFGGGTSGLPPVVRVGVPDARSRVFGSGAAAAAFDAAVTNLPGAPIDLAPFFEAARLLYDGPWVAERYAAIRAFIEAKPQSLHPVTRAIIEGARRFSAADAFAGVYRLADLKQATAAVWDRIDILVVPSIPDVCTLEQAAAEPIAANARLGTYTNFVNLLDLCALAIPGPRRSDGRPSGITLIAPAGRDGLLAAFAERRSVPVAPPPNMIELAVVGAHLSGMALNHQLLAAGAVFLRQTRTTADYRLFALPGGPPARPGLLRVPPGAGSAIAVEVWAMPPAGFGSFVAGIPAPLGIGTLALEDATAVKGFLCEAEATRGARDITSFGGWRAFVG